MDEWVDQWMNGQMDESMSFSTSPSCNIPIAVPPNVHGQPQPSSLTPLLNRSFTLSFLGNFIT